MSGLRKLFIGLISLVAVFGVYLLYTTISKTPPIEIDTGSGLTGTFADGNVVGHDGDVGRIGDTEIWRLEGPKYIHRDPTTKEIDREFGFNKLLRSVRGAWEVEKPWMKVYQRGFDCHITADKGVTRLETVVGRATPKDATFTGNVVIHILPAETAGRNESFIYLDDLIFLSDNSQFSTAGPVKFVSEDTRMYGRGLKFVYNDQTERLDYLRLFHLESLSFDGSKLGLFSKDETQPDEPPVAAARDKPTAVSASQDANTSPVAEPNEIRPTVPKYYKCILSKNVLVDTPEHLIFAEQELFISDILWSKASSRGPNEPNTVAEYDPNDRNITVAKPDEPNQSPEPVDIVITSDDGILLVPMDSPKTLKDFATAGAAAIDTDGRRPKKLDDPEGRATFLARRIEHNASTGDTVATGSPKLTFYVEDSNATDPNKSAVPVTVTAAKAARFFKALNQATFEEDCLCTMPREGSTGRQNFTLSAPKLIVNFPKDKSKSSSSLPEVVAAAPVELTFFVKGFGAGRTKEPPLPAKLTAKKHARFLPSLNQVTFEGDCECTMVKVDPNFQEKFLLRSQQLTVDLPADTNDRSSGAIAGIKHLTAQGGVVTLASVKTVKQKQLGGILLECRRFDYDTGQEFFLATGPGALAIDNSQITPAKTDPGQFSLGKPCYTFLRNFDTLKYFLQENRIVAEATSPGALLIDYFPVTEGKYDKHGRATAGHLVAQLMKTAEGKNELSTLIASGGIRYADDDNEFIGDRLFYDHAKALMKVTGSRILPCQYNGKFVDAIEYDLKTDKVKAKLVGPSTLRSNR